MCARACVRVFMWPGPQAEDLPTALAGDTGMVDAGVGRDAGGSHGTAPRGCEGDCSCGL